MCDVDDEMTPGNGRWKLFEPRQLQEAFRHVDNGGIAVHISGFKFKGHDTAHLLAKDESSLRRAAADLGLDPKWIQKTGTSRGRSRVHFDIFGAPLRKANALCPQGEPTTTGSPNHEDPT